MVNNFRFRLNGFILCGIRIQPAAVAGEEHEDWELAVYDRQLGWFTLEEDGRLDPALPEFVLEYRDETEGERLHALGQRLSQDQGWQRTTPQELVALLQGRGGMELAEDETVCLQLDAPLDSAEFLRQEAKKLRLTRAEVDARAEELLQRLEFACMLYRGCVRLP